MMEITVKSLRKIGLPFAGWEVSKELGTGSFGSVFRIESKTGEICALKVIPVPRTSAEAYEAIQLYGGDIERARASFDGMIERIRDRELKTVKQCAGCPNVYRIFEDVVVDDPAERVQRYIMVRMELLVELKTYLSAPGMRQRDVIKMMSSICSALAYMQSQGILHRDIKPANIMVDGRGTYKLTDFGEARVMERESSQTISRGTPYYMAPEVTRSSHYGHRADIYSLGVVGYYLLNGLAYPFSQYGCSAMEGYERRMKGERCPDIAGVDPMINRVLHGCLAYRPESRLDAVELLRELNALLKDPEMGNKPLLLGKNHRTTAGSGSSAKDSGAGNGLSAGAIVGIVAGSIALLALIILLIVASTQNSSALHDTGSLLERLYGAGGNMVP